MRREDFGVVMFSKDAYFTSNTCCLARATLLYSAFAWELEALGNIGSSSGDNRPVVKVLQGVPD